MGSTITAHMPADRILVVDDEEAIREIVSSMLTNANYNCRQAASGNEALALLSSGEEFELMLSDLMMADLDGIGLLERTKERFLIGKTSKGTPADLPRNLQGIALTGDPRQDENLILAQMHVAFLKLHNLVISSRKEMAASPHYKQEGDSDFAIAQRVVRWHYQWIVRHDYLETIVCESIAKKLEDMEKAKRVAPPVNFKIPVEFSMAAFRFGHSMVRNRYDSISHTQKDVTLEKLLSLTGAQGLTPPGAQENTALPDEWRVCWNRFFEILPTTSWINRAETIDTKIAGTLHHLDEPHLKQFSARVLGEAVEPSLPVRSLLRGFRAGLPSG